MREATGYRLPVSVKLGAGRVSDDVKIAVKDGFDFIELDGMQGSTGAGSAEVIDYVGCRRFPPSSRRSTRWRRLGAAPCQVACPVGTDVPSCIAHIWDEDYEAAFEAIEYKGEPAEHEGGPCGTSFRALPV